MGDLDCLKYYHGNGSSQINKELRQRHPKHDISIEISVNRALNRLKSVPNNKVFRVEQSICSFDETKNWFKERLSKIIKFPAFTSCSFERDWMNNREFIFEIKTSLDTNAHSLLELFPGHPESEVLFKSKTNFKIEKVNEITKTITLIETKKTHDIVIYQNECFFTNSTNKSSQIQSLSDSDEI